MSSGDIKKGDDKDLSKKKYLLYWNRHAQRHALRSDYRLLDE